MRRSLQYSPFGSVLPALVLSVWLVFAGPDTLADVSRPGEMVADFTLPALNGQTQHALSDFRGQVVYLDFWASWCGPCRLSLPALDDLYREFGPEGFTVLAVNVDAYEEAAADFLASYPVDYPVLRDADRALPKRFGIKGMPTAFLIDRQGRLVGIHQGFRKGDGEKLRGKIAELLERDSEP